MKKNKYLVLINDGYVFGAHTYGEGFFTDLDEYGEEVAYDREDQGTYGYMDLSGPILLGIIEAENDEKALELAIEKFKLDRHLLEVEEI